MKRGSPAGSDVPSASHVGTIERLRGDLTAAGYTEQGARDLLGVLPGTAVPPAVQRARALRLDHNDPRAVAVMLFRQARPVLELEAAAHFDTDGLCAAGILRRVGEKVVSRIVIVPVGDLLVAGDVENYDDIDPNIVPSVHLASLWLAYLTPRPRVTLSFDAGTGNGVQALLAAAHSDHALAGDVNPRALQMARLNSVLNGISNVECVEGSWLDPVEDRSPGLIVANPPFIISAEAHILYRDGGPAAPAVSRDIVRRAARVLSPGGFGAVICNWPTAEGAPWSATPTGWLDGLGCDAWIFHAVTSDAPGYALFAAGTLRDHDARAFERAIEDRAAMLEEAGMRSISVGVIVIRKRAGGTPWTRYADLSGAPSAMSGAQVERMFDGVDAVGAATTDALLNYAFEVVDGHVVEQTLIGRSTGYEARSAAVRSTAAIEVRFDPRLLPVLFMLDGRRTLRECVERAAPAIHADATELCDPAAACVRVLAEAGYVRRVF